MLALGSSDRCCVELGWLEVKYKHHGMLVIRLSEVQDGWECQLQAQTLRQANGKVSQFRELVFANVGNAEKAQGGCVGCAVDMSGWPLGK